MASSWRRGTWTGRQPSSIITDGIDPNRGVLSEEGDVDSDLDVAATVDGDVPADVNGGDGGGPAVSVDGGNDGATVA